GSIVAMLFRTIDIYIYANMKILNRSSWKAFWCMFSNALTFGIIYLCFNTIKITFYSYIDIILKGIIIGVIVLFFYVFMQSILNPKEFKNIFQHIKIFFQRKKF
ncbi:MAG: hypothetical protein IJQ66_02650, partial [Clostridia bacterium]|nr:hypothetical protein [Clostridia bacterium]